MRTGEIRGNKVRSGRINVRSCQKLGEIGLTDMSPGISFSARVIVFLPQSAREMSATLYGTWQDIILSGRSLPDL